MSTKIEWTEETWNPVQGCFKVSPGCKNCYAIRQVVRLSENPNEKISRRYRGITAGMNWTGSCGIDEEVLLQPLRRKKPTTYFISLSDLFYDKRPDEDIDRVFAVMALCPEHTFQILTKYAGRMQAYWRNPADLRGRWWDALHDARIYPGDPRRAVLGSPSRAGVAEGIMKGWRPLTLPNVWLGVSAENQQYADERISLLKQTPAALRFLSLEPLLADIGTLDLEGIDWVIVGGESGPGARACDVAWVRSIVRQCADAGVPCFVKQLGAKPYELVQPDGGSGIFLKDKKGGDPAEWPEDLRVRQMPEVRRG